jgi:hypothetical protein
MFVFVGKKPPFGRLFLRQDTLKEKKPSTQRTLRMTQRSTAEGSTFFGASF